MNREKLIEFEGGLSIIINSALFVLKIWAGFVSGSVAIIADAWHTLSDSVSSVIIIIGSKISSKKADQLHPFGHGRAENIAAIVVSILLIFVAFSFVKESIYRLINFRGATYGKISLYVTVISIILKEINAQFAFWAAKRTGAVILKADAWHHRSDAFSSLVILLGIFLGRHFFWVDGVMGIIVGIFIFYTAYEIFKDSINPLLGCPVSPEILHKVEKICQSIVGERCYVHHFHLHEYGKHQELTFHIMLPPSLSLEEGHKTITLIENKIENELGIEATIHMEPYNNKDFDIKLSD